LKTEPTQAKTFGDYLRKLREEKSISQRGLARRLGISAPYLNDIEKGKRNAPRNDILILICRTLEADPDTFFDLAGSSRNSIPADIEGMIENSPETVSLLRTIHDFRPSEYQLREIRESIMAEQTSAIIIAAGMGTRLMPLTSEKPKCMLEFGGATLLERQIQTYRKCGITDISVVRGYQKEKINLADCQYYENDDYETNNILHSLFYARDAIKGHVICAYSDILFEPAVVARALECSHDIAVVVDIDWQDYYIDRKDHPINEAEAVIFDANNEVKTIGKISTDKDDVHGEFIGMLRLSPRGSEILCNHFDRAKLLYSGKPFQRAEVFEKAYLTDMVQELIDLGVPVHTIIIERGWKEIDTIEDYKKALINFQD